MFFLIYNQFTIFWKYKKMLDVYRNLVWDMVWDKGDRIRQQPYIWIGINGHVLSDISSTELRPK